MGRFDQENRDTMENRFEKVKGYLSEHATSEGRTEHEEKIARYITRGEKIRPQKPSPREWKKTVPAARGFHGYITEPIHFLAGEKGRERVDIHRTRKKHHAHNFWDVSEYFGGNY